MARRMTRRRSDAVNNLDGLRKMLWMDSLPDQLLHRDEEIRRIEEFCRLFITQKDDCYSLYLGGVPGTGKTSCVLQVGNML
jgi:Cdc6-like AAA superfamily ATPase